MHTAQHPPWQLVAAQYGHVSHPDVERHVAAALASPPLSHQRALLERRGLRIDPVPALYRHLPGPYLRLFFRISGDSPAVEEGTIVALVLLHDPRAGRTLYAHPVLAGPEANPLLKHLYGPLAEPKAQAGDNGRRATLRLLEHKRAIWEQFGRERETLGPEQAGRRWRERFFWALVRLYFCERCPACRWGTPYFDGPAGEPHRPPSPPPNPPPRINAGLAVESVEALRHSELWHLEAAYAQRGGFTVRQAPQLAVRLAGGGTLAVFPTDAEFLQPGALVGLAVYARPGSRDVYHAHTLCAGAEPELPFLFGDRGLGLPPPQPGATGAAARAAYVAWRRDAWSRFWLDELEEGLHAASRNWLNAFWQALARLFGADAGRAPTADRARP